jgi:hypothetical protein
VDEATTTLATDDWRLGGGGRLERLATGTHTAYVWGDRVTVVYVPLVDSAQRTLILIQLCKLAAQYEGVAQDTIGGGDYSMAHLPFHAERERLMRSLAPRAGVVFG